MEVFIAHMMEVHFLGNPSHPQINTILSGTPQKNGEAPYGFPLMGIHQTTFHHPTLCSNSFFPDISGSHPFRKSDMPAAARFA
jgi:hypothetical protein